jgi:hypothetical protein
MAKVEEKTPNDRSDGNESGAEVRAAANSLLTAVLLPAWVAAGFGDYICHRATHIERTSGTHESITHSLMIATSGVGVMAALLFDVNETVLWLMLTSATVHEAIVLRDVGYAAGRRNVTPTEQHLHSFLEVLPWAGFAFTACLNPRDAKKLAATALFPRPFRLRPKKHPVPLAYLVATFAVATVGLVLPYAEELLRCYRTDGTLLPHRKPPTDREGRVS